MIVDCHTHIDVSADEAALSEHYAAQQTVDVSIVLGRHEDKGADGNKKLGKYVERYRSRTVGFAVIDPTVDNIGVGHLRLLREKYGLEGAVLYCSRCGFHPAHSRAMRFYESALELAMPLFFHNTEPIPGGDAALEYSQPYQLDEVAREFPSLKIVIGAMGVPFVGQTLWMIAKHANVYADLTVRPSSVWQIYNMVVAANEYAVMDKLLFGSGYPLSTAGECIETLLGFNMLLADTNLPTVPRSKIRGIIERDTLSLLGIEREVPAAGRRGAEAPKQRSKQAVGEDPEIPDD